MPQYPQPMTATDGVISTCLESVEARSHNSALFLESPVSAWCTEVYVDRSESGLGMVPQLANVKTLNNSVCGIFPNLAIGGSAAGKAPNRNRRNLRSQRITYFISLILNGLDAPSGAGPVSPCYLRIGNVAHETHTERRRAVCSPASSLGPGGVGSACPGVPGR